MIRKVTDEIIYITPTRTVIRGAATPIPVTFFWLRVRSGPDGFLDKWFSPYDAWEDSPDRAATFEINAEHQLIISNPGTDGNGNTFTDGVGQTGAVGLTRVNAEDVQFDSGIVFFNLRHSPSGSGSIMNCCINQDTNTVTGQRITITSDYPSAGTLNCFANQDPTQNVWNICQRTSDHIGDYLWLTNESSQPTCGTTPTILSTPMVLEVVPLPHNL